MKAKLGQVTSIQTGYSLRVRIKPEPDGSVLAIQMKDLASNNRVDCSELTRIKLEKVKRHHLAQVGDLVLRSRGQNPKSALIVENPGTAVVISPLLRIRITDNRLTPEYLNWFINQSNSQTWLASRMMGSHGGMVTKSTVEEMEIDIPPIKNQKLAIELSNLCEREKNLMEKLANKKGEHINAIIMKYLKGEQT